jgi:hypothetical protein
MVTQIFKLWDYLQIPLEVTNLYNQTHAIEVEVAQKKWDIGSFPPKERVVSMHVIATWKKEITLVRTKNQNI